MRILAAELHHYRLPLRETLVSAAGEFSHRAGCLLRISTDISAVATAIVSRWKISATNL